MKKIKVRPWSIRKDQTIRHAELRRELLIIEMGGRCQSCGAKQKLEIDHVNGRDWEPRKVNRWVRIARYWREFHEGKLQLLCRKCNARKQ